MGTVLYYVLPPDPDGEGRTLAVLVGQQSQRAVQAQDWFWQDPGLSATGPTRSKKRKEEFRREKRGRSGPVGT